jgi:hypothetical protein
VPDVHYDFCTLFDASYLPRALALYRSLERCCRSFTLRALCMDEQSRELLDALDVPDLKAIAIADLERRDPELGAARPTRSPTEYCWTCTPALCLFVLDTEPHIEALTYLDADLCFHSDPEPLRAELGDGSILLVPDQLSGPAGHGGKFNVSWVGFRNDANARAALEWWRERCIEWCYDRVEPDRYGDQKYLDSWPERFVGVRVSMNPAVGVATWNEGRRHLEPAPGGGVLVDGVPLVFHHYSSFNVHPLTRTGRFLARWHPDYRTTAGPIPLVWTVFGRPSAAALEYLWRPFMKRFSDALAELVGAGAPPRLGTTPVRMRVVASQLARERATSRFLRVYRRVPARVRHRIGRLLTSSARARP